MRGSPIPANVKETALDLYEEGLPFSEISSTTGVSKGALSGIVNERVQKDPDFVETHNLARYMRINHHTPEALKRGADLLDELGKRGLSLENAINLIIPLLESVDGSLVQVCKDASVYFKLVRSTGKTLDDLIEEHSSLAKHCELLTRKISEREEALRNLETRVKAAKSELVDLEGLEQIEKQLENVGKEPKETSEVLTTTQKMLESGLTLEVLNVISLEIKNKG